jgi:hypothetical protein
MWESSRLRKRESMGRAVEGVDDAVHMVLSFGVMVYLCVASVLEKSQKNLDSKNMNSKTEV